MPGVLLLEDVRRANSDELNDHLRTLLAPGQGYDPSNIVQRTAPVMDELQSHLNSLMAPAATPTPAPAPTPTPVATPTPASPMDTVNELANHVSDITGGALNLVGQGLTNLQQAAQSVVGQGVTPVQPAAQPAPAAIETTPSEGVTPLAAPAAAVAPATAGAMPDVQVDPSSPEAFIRSITPAAKWLEARTGIPAEAMIGMAANETGYGKFAAGNNLFGIKGTGPAGSTNARTWEDYGAGPVAERANFRAYHNAAESFQDFVDLLRRGTPDRPDRYLAALSADTVEHFTEALRRGGYMTDPNYTGKVKSIVDRFRPIINQTAADVSPAEGVTRAGAVLGDVARVRDISQFGDAQLTSDEAYAACGPAAAVRFAQRFGRNPSLREALNLAKTVGWTSAQGMAGIASEKALMDKMGVATKLVSGPQWDVFAKEAQTGNPVTISTSGHYFTADGYDPNTKRFHVGRSGLDLKAGKEWMTADEMTSVMGPVQGALLADNPSVPTTSTVSGTTEPSAGTAPLQSIEFTAPQTTTPAPAQTYEPPKPEPLRIIGDVAGQVTQAAQNVGQGALRVIDDAIDTAAQVGRQITGTEPQAATPAMPAPGFGYDPSALRPAVAPAEGVPPRPIEAAPPTAPAPTAPPPPAPAAGVGDQLKQAFGDFVDQVGGVFTAPSGPSNRRVEPPTGPPTAPEDFTYTEPNIPVSALAKPRAPTLTNPVTGQPFEAPGGISLEPPRDIREAAERAITEASRRPFPGIGPTGPSLINPQFGPQGGAEGRALRGPAGEVLSATEEGAANAVRAAVSAGTEAAEAVGDAVGKAQRAAKGWRPIDYDKLAQLRRDTRAEQPGLSGMPSPQESNLNRVVASTVNSVFSLPSLFTNAVSGAVQTVQRPVMTALSGDWGAAGTDLRAMGHALADGFADFGTTFTTGFRPSRGAGADVQPEAFTGPAGMIWTGFLRAMGATDEFFRTVNSAGAQGMRTVQLMREHPELSQAEVMDRFAPEILNAGERAAAESVFAVGGTGLGQKISGVRAWLTQPDANWPQRALGLAANILVPFSNVPDVILTQGFKRLPIASELTMISQLKSDDPAVRRRAIASEVMAEVINVAIFAEVLEGNITGNGPSDPDKKAALTRARDANGDPIWQPTSVRITTPDGHKHFFPYSSLGPVAVRMAAIANITEQLDEEARKPNPSEDAMMRAVRTGANVLQGTGESVGDAWYLQTVGMMFNAMKYGGIPSFIGRQITSTAMRVLPYGGEARQAERFTNPTVSEPQNPLEAIAAQIPFLSQVTTPKIDPATGQPIREPQDVSGVFVSRAVGPSEPNRVNELLGRHNMSVPPPADTVSFGKRTIPITPDEQRRIVTFEGPEIAREILDLDTPEFRQEPLDEQRKDLEVAIRRGRKVGQNAFVNTLSDEEIDRRSELYAESQRRKAEPGVRLSAP